jgi:transposase
LRFYDFRMALVHRCQSSGILLNFFNEDYTTKACSACGVHNHTIGASKIARCHDPTCRVIADRDGGAACTLLKKYLFTATLYVAPEIVAALYSVPAVAMAHYNRHVFFLFFPPQLLL